ncbi:branched-chain amino acid transport system II carrier protein [Avibacterium paragallinarum]|uniref:Branched-chain amino acid transport system carrier protein n=1 Tax=Avibacterium paragallinarum TaxID=728 RepID=A0AAE5TGN2_AVIPA|nr:branched-chain amino acid transport system II carrier protein [Avibacterium paragallinarum]MEE3609618.1 branched-chain amino acid transport system II carrier protein [Avibacterium paragallinarum]MEE3621579.1 branched-chain amino acid transport system II carrier protein [Avibacterium paragallinarum]MEE3669320.1 branched-chain amino acid transport system II carrier protein [Avibacterium paragallinarum]MEE3681750.1 branched-chain amino acid transport system II carrier protein [Avibacterium para
MTKNTFIIGFMLFAIFFGAGNLIFPPKLGFETGTEFLPSISGFVLTGVGLPLLGIIVSAFYRGGYIAALKQIHPGFSVLFLVSISLAVGPFFAGPRTGAMSYEMVMLPFLHQADALSQLAFTAVYFAITLWLSLNPSKMVERIGSILTPVLLIAIIALVLKAVFMLMGKTPLPMPADSHQYFFNGAINGYLTMDALASIAFSTMVLGAIKSSAVKAVSLQKQTIFAAMIAGVALAFIYISLGWVGNHLMISPDVLAQLHQNKQDLGTYILNHVTAMAFGEAGRFVLNVIVSLACLTTAVGLCASISSYFAQQFPRFSYRTYAMLFCIISFVIANLGLKEVIGLSLPVLMILYPITITVILLLLINLFLPMPILAHRLAISLVTFVSILSVLGSGKIDFLEQLPFKPYSIEWLPFALVGLVAGYLLHWRKRQGILSIIQENKVK